DGTHHRLAGAHPGPAPAHDVEIWLGAYNPRMLRLTGAKADGWMPSVGYAAIAELGEMCAVIDEGAQRAGRRPGDIRRMLNVGSVGGETFPSGESSSWPAQIAHLPPHTGTTAVLLRAGQAR